MRHQSISVATGFGAIDWIYQYAIVERQSKLSILPFRQRKGINLISSELANEIGGELRAN